MLNTKTVEPELISNAHMYLFFGKGMRGKVSCISKKYSKANNKHWNFYDLKQESKHIIYIDPNNLHRYAISRFLPTTGFKWVDPIEFDLNKYQQ